MAVLFVDQLTVIDCAVLDAQRGLLGESWIVDLELAGDLDAQSMVLDFSEVKRRIKRAIDAGPDHTLLVARHMPGVVLAQDGEQVHLSAVTGIGAITLSAPTCSVTVLDADAVSPHALMRHCEALIRAVVPASVQHIGLHLRTEAIEGAQYQYVHGLKKHDGACQRIAHGHRSRIVVEAAGVRAPELEATLAARLADRYIVSRDDIVTVSAEGALTTAYAAPEGHFELQLPVGRCVVIDSDSTVECLADWLLGEALALTSARPLRVRAFEGVNKGALAAA
jgi:6-pyruvoyl-tetrahydropterin synthase